MAKAEALRIQFADGINKPVVLFFFGKWKTSKYGEMDLNQEFAEQIIENFDNKALGTEPFFDDGNHEEDKATGWIKRLYIEGEALYADVDWTPLGIQLLSDKVYQYSSIHVDQHKNPVDGKVYYPVLKNVSLTNIPVLRMLPAIELSEMIDVPLTGIGKQLEDSLQQRVDQIRDAFYAQTSSNRWDVLENNAWVRDILEDSIIIESNDGLIKVAYSIGDDGSIIFDFEKREKVEIIYKTKMTEEGEMEQELREMLGLDEGADVLVAIKALKEKAEKPEPVTLSEYQKTSEEVKSLTTKLAERDRDDAVNAAIKAGKVAPAQREWAKEYALADPSGFAKFIEAAPVAIKLGEKGGDGELAIELTAEEIKQAKVFGLTEAELMAGKKELQMEEVA